MGTENAVYRPRMLRRASAQGIGLTLPESISSKRLAISCAQAASALVSVAILRDSIANSGGPKAKVVFRYNELMFDRNSAFARVLLSLSMSSSMASTGESGFSTLRSTQMRARSSLGMMSSSLRVPER